MKKILSTVLATGLLLTACGGEKTVKQEDVIKFGALGPLTGPLAIFGVSATNGTKLAVEEINANGGINGKKIELNLLDDMADPTEAVNGYNKLLDWGMVAMIGDVPSKPSLAVAEASAKDGLPTITPTGTQMNITEAGPNVFRVAFTDPYQGKMLAKITNEKFKSKNVAIMVNSSSDYSDGVAKAYADELKKMSINVVAEEAYADGDKDFKAQLTKIKTKNPDLLFVPDYYEQDGLIAMQAKELGMNVQILGADGWDGVSKILDKSSYDAIENVYFSSHYSDEEPSEKVQNFVSKYREKYKDEPSAFSALSYDTVYLLKQAIENAGTTEKTKLVEAIKNINFSGVTGSLTYDDKNNPIKSMTLLKIVDGKYKFDSVAK